MLQKPGSAPLRAPRMRPGAASTSSSCSPVILIAGILARTTATRQTCSAASTRAGVSDPPAYLVLLPRASLPIGGAPQIAEGEVRSRSISPSCRTCGARPERELRSRSPLLVTGHRGTVLTSVCPSSCSGSSDAAWVVAAVMLLVPPLLRCLCLATGWRSPGTSHPAGSTRRSGECSPPCWSGTTGPPR